MSYSASDFADDIEMNADFVGVPILPLADLAALGLDPESDSDGYQILAERVGRALGDRQALGAALVHLLADLDELADEFDICREISASGYGDAARAAIRRATGAVSERLKAKARSGHGAV
jgi:hypothetical protein